MRRFVISGLSLLAFSTDALAQNWEPARRSDATNAGIVAWRVVSDDANTTVTAVACQGGRASLVLAGTGGDPPTGAITIRIGDQSFALTFVENPALGRQGLQGLPTVSGAASREVLLAMRQGSGLRLPGVQRPISLAGFGRQWPAIERACAATLASAAGASSGQPSTQAAQPPATGRGAPYGVWVFPDGLTGQCVDGGPGFAIERDSILISDGGETQTWNNVSFVSCSGDVCTFQQRGSNLRWSTRWLSADRIILNGPQLDRRAARVEGIRENVAARCSMVR